MSPNKANIRLWVDALRSGRYPQGEGSLRSEGAYCCLGVACEVAITHGLPLEPVNEGYQVRAGAAPDEATLPEVVQSWLGLDGHDPIIIGEVRAIAANDALGWTFRQIADAIEQHYGLAASDG